MSRSQISNDEQNVILHLEFIKKRRCLHYSLVGPFSFGTNSVLVMNITRTIQGETDQEIIIVQKFRPFIIDYYTVCLYTIVDLDVVRVEFALQLDN